MIDYSDDRVIFVLNGMMDFRLVGRSPLNEWDGFSMRAGPLSFFDSRMIFFNELDDINSDHTGG